MPSPQERETALFQAAAQLSGAERTVFLNGACHGDPALRQRLDALLAAQDQPDSLPVKAAPAAKATIKLDLAPEPPDEAVGQTLGRYKLWERVGEGGCGVVYVAEQTQPVRRRVALNVIKLGMDTKQVVARFEAERQALAMTDHPNIAKVLDAGTTDVGRPYFVMELVRGIKITDYCDQANLTTKERLDLFIKVCQAIKHAQEGRSPGAPSRGTAPHHHERRTSSSSAPGFPVWRRRWIPDGRARASRCSTCGRCSAAMR